MSGFFGMLFKLFFDSIAGWFKQEQAASVEWAAEARKQQLESLKDGLEREKRLREEHIIDVEKSKDFTIDDWINGKTLLLLPFVLVCSGCFRFYVYTKPYQPVPPALPERPEFVHDVDGDGVNDPVTEREMSIIRYAAIVEAAYNRLRQDIVRQNVEAGYPNTAE